MHRFFEPGGLLNLIRDRCTRFDILENPVQVVVFLVIAAVIIIACLLYNRKKPGESETSCGIIDLSLPPREKAVSSSMDDDNVIETLYTCQDEWHDCCPRCGSTSYIEEDFYFDSDNAVAKTLYRCQSCGKSFQVND